MFRLLSEYSLPYGQNEVIEALAAANPNTIAVILTGNPYSMPWVNKVPAIVQGWYGGSEAGHIIADVLFGEVNPSGKLPMTFAKDLTDYAAHAAGDASVYPGVNGDVTYKEGLDVGYRHTEKHHTLSKQKAWCFSSYVFFLSLLMVYSGTF